MKALMSLLMMAVLLVYPGNVSDAARQALRIWGHDVVPSLFPFMVLSQTLSSSIGSHKKASFALSVPLGLLGGSPSGSASLAAVAETSPPPPRRLLSLAALTGTISPMFFLGTVSCWLGSDRDAQKLLIAHLGGALIAGLIVFLLSSRAVFLYDKIIAPKAVKPQSPVMQSAMSVLNVGGCIVFYSVVAACLTLVCPFLSAEAAACIHAVMEISGGLRALASLSIQESTRLILCAAASGFGGLSIITQNAFFLNPLGISTGLLILFGLLRAAGASLLMSLLL